MNATTREPVDTSAAPSGSTSGSGTILVVDDERPVRFAICEVLRDAGYSVLEADSVQAALEHLARAELIISDLAMPGQDGLQLLNIVRREQPETPLLILTAHGNERAAVSAMKSGAADYLTKPFDIDELRLSVQRALERKRLLASDQRRVLQEHTGQWLVGESAVFQQLLRTAARVASRDVNVLLSGETGTGKEGIASLIHAASSRRDRPLVRFNCGAITESLAQAELFGHTKGAFTGAHQPRDGYFQRAHKGTLVLDEVAELPLTVQAALLRALQQGEVQPVGATSTSAVDVRVVACSAVSLEERVREGRFRADLYYRLRVVELRVPSLAERASDIPLLCRHFQLKYAERFGLSDVPLPQALVLLLAGRPWPGNVRQLENRVAEILALSDDGVVSESAEPSWRPTDVDPRTAQTRESDVSAATPLDPDSSEVGLRERVMAFERSLIERALASAAGNQSQAARSLGTTRTTLIDKMKRFGLT
jgi:DNA-binding NtrC family response regulator